MGATGCAGWMSDPNVPEGAKILGVAGATIRR
jgi:hypothetical protein